jgi:23S rRNA (guanosine2251-2'-O)-methyltransferase
VDDEEGDVAQDRARSGRDARSPKDTFITVYGRMPVLEALEHPDREVDKVIVAEGASGASLEMIIDLAERRGIPVQYATANRVKLLAGNGKHDQGVMADVVAPGMTTIAEFLRHARPDRPYRLLVLDGVNNPANVGMIIRTATAAGLSGVVLPHVNSPGVDPLVIKASAGVAFRAAIVRSSTAADATRELRQAGFKLYGLSGDARTSLFQTPLAPRSAFVIGNETKGLSPATSGSIDQWLAIPMRGGVESLNVASAAAVLCFEVLRRAEANPTPPRSKRSSPQAAARPARRARR